MPARPTFRPRAQCETCSLIKAGDTALEKRINLSKRFVPGGESILSISRDYVGKLTYKSLNTHSLKHQAPNKAALKSKIKQHATREAFKEIQAAESGRQVTVYTNQSDMRRELLAKGKEALESGDVKMTMAAIVQLLGQEQKAEEAAKDRGLEMMKMFNYFASGAGGGRQGPTSPIEGEIVGD